MINFFVKFDEFQEVPKVKAISIDGISICINQENVQTASSMETIEGSENSTQTVELSLQDLPLERFPNVTQIPQNVNNVGFFELFPPHENYFETLNFRTILNVASSRTP